VRVEVRQVIGAALAGDLQRRRVRDHGGKGPVIGVRRQRQRTPGRGKMAADVRGASGVNDVFPGCCGYGGDVPTSRAIKTRSANRKLG